MQTQDPYATLPDPTKQQAAPTATADPYANMPDPYASMPDAATGTTQTPASLYQRMRDKFMSFTAPSTSPAQNEVQAAADLGKGALRGAATMVRHPIDAITGTLRFGRDLGAGLLVTDKGIKAHPGDPANNYGLLPRAVGDEILREKDELHDTLHQGRMEFQQNPSYFLGEQLGQMIVAEGAGKGIRGVKEVGGRLIDNTKAQTPGALRTTAQRMFGAGDEFQKANIDRYAKDAERVRATNAKRAELNAERQAQHKAATEKTAAQNRKVISKFQNASQEHQATVDQSVKANDQEIAELKAKQDAAAQTEKIRQQTMDEHQRLSAEQEKAHETAGKKAKLENDTNWDKWRAKVANVPADMTSVVGEINKQAKVLDNPGLVAEFRQILRETTPDEEMESPVEEERTRVSKSLGYSSDYENLRPDQRAMVDRIVNETPGLDLTEDEEGDEELKPIPASRLHVIKSGLEAKVRTAQGPIKYSIGRVLDAVRAKEAEVSTAAGADAELAAARATHGPYVDTFRNSPNERMTVSSKSLAETSPDYVKEQARLKRLQMLARYDSTIPKRAERIRSLQQTLSGLPSQTETANTNAPEPEPPTLRKKPTMGELKELPKPKKQVAPVANPTAPDLTELTRDKLTSGLKKYGTPGSWVLRLIVGGATAHLMKGDVSALGTDLLIGQAAVTVLTKALRSEKVLDWMSQPSKDTLELLDKIPPADAQKLRDALTHLAAEDVRKGVKKPIDPKVAAFLGARNLAIINAGATANRLNTAAEAKRRMQEVMNDVVAPPN